MIRDFSFLPPAWDRCAEHWLNSVFDRSGSEHTLNDYTCMLYQFLRYIKKDPGLATRADMASWLAETSTSARNPGVPLSASTKNTRLACIRAFYDWASAYEVDGQMLYDRANPCAGFRTMKRDFQARQMSEEEIKRFFAHIPGTKAGRKLRALFYLYLILGRRKSELLRLQWQNIVQTSIDGHPAMSYQYIGKGNSRLRRQKELPSEAYQVIIDLLKSEGRLETIQPGDYLFISSGRGRATRRGLPLTGNYVSGAFHRIAKEAGLPVERLSLHSLRWSSAFWRMQNGSTIMEVRDILDHQNISITEHYLMAMRADHDTGAAALVNRFKFLR